MASHESPSSQRLALALTDNAGWRMHVPGYPMVTAIGGNIPRQPSDRMTPRRSDRKGSWCLTPAHSTQGFYSTPTFTTSSTLRRRDSLAHRPGNTGRQAAESGAPWILADAEILTLSHPGRTAAPEPTHTLFDDPTQALHGSD